MTYKRVIPRDLFNESALLKCLGKLWIHLDRLAIPGVHLQDSAQSWTICQNEGTGGIYCPEIFLTVRGEVIALERPLNSPDSWALYATTPDDIEFEVFRPLGELTREFFEFLKG